MTLRINAKVSKKNSGYRKHSNVKRKNFDYLRGLNPKEELLRIISLEFPTEAIQSKSKRTLIINEIKKLNTDHKSIKQLSKLQKENLIILNYVYKINSKICKF